MARWPRLPAFAPGAFDACRHVFGAGWPYVKAMRHTTITIPPCSSGSSTACWRGCKPSCPTGRARHGLAGQPLGLLLRLPLAILCMIGGVFSFLPVLGVWMLPLGVLLIAVDVPLVRRWVVHFWP